MRRSVLRAVDSAKPLVRAPRGLSRNFASVNGNITKVRTSPLLLSADF